MESSSSPQGPNSPADLPCKIWALADLHLSFGVPNKEMSKFGWINHVEEIEKNWRLLIKNEDLVLIPGDISWAKTPKEALPDLEFLHSLPGTKLLLKGNHDYWWPSNQKLSQLLPPSLHFICNTTFNFRHVTIGGTRFWDSPEYTLNYETKTDLKIYAREVERLKLSLASLNPVASHRIVMTHYPPIGMEMQDSEASLLFEKYKIDHIVFGHLHNMDPSLNLYGEKGGTKYHLVACDYLKFSPLLIMEL
ncbi:MAG: metallophosphoesterase [Simkaniaceae bacterium]|nr:metallophosphoesterase [Simkaniaceae bacterium]